MIHATMHLMTIEDIKHHFHNLTRREAEVLYFLIRGYNAREIADKLNLKKRTINGYIDNIKNRWGVTSKGSLIEKAIDMGYSTVMPCTLYPTI